MGKSQTKCIFNKYLHTASDTIIFFSSNFALDAVSWSTLQVYATLASINHLSEQPKTQAFSYAFHQLMSKKAHINLIR